VPIMRERLEALVNVWRLKWRDSKASCEFAIGSNVWQHFASVLNTSGRSEDVRSKLTAETDAHRQLALRKDLEQKDYQDRLDRLVCPRLPREPSLRTRRRN
jgi:hypothetical protein